MHDNFPPTDEVIITPELLQESLGIHHAVVANFHSDGTAEWLTKPNSEGRSFFVLSVNDCTHATEIPETLVERVGKAITTPKEDLAFLAAVRRQIYVRFEFEMMYKQLEKTYSTTIFDLLSKTIDVGSILVCLEEFIRCRIELAEAKNWQRDVYQWDRLAFLIRLTFQYMGEDF